ncbi:hypothetical protein A9Q86_02495 [Flavobacteriales bacterium 33_180_T64]|nr:hypothetical protein A9Q86_02495 [Flavobacteriales bacterium 33_180_T64]
MKHLTRILIIMFGMAITLTNCENDLLDEKPMTNSFSEQGKNGLIQTGKIKEFENLNLYLQELKSRDNFLSRSSIEDDYGFSILSDHNIYMYADSITTTYTLGIERDNQNTFGFSNLIVEFSNENATNAYILNYVPSQEYLNSYVANNNVPFQGVVNYEPIDYDGSLDNLNERRTCKSITLTFCNYGGETHAAGENCTADFMFDVTYDICYDSNSGEPLNESIDPPSGNSSGGGSSNSNPTNPLPTDTCQGSNGDIGLTGSDGNCYNADVITLADQLNAILGEGESFEFIENNTNNDLLNFDSIEAFIAFLNEINNSSEGTSSSSTTLDGQTVRTEVIKINSFPEVFFNVQFILTSPEEDVTEDYSVSNINSSITGIVLLSSWEETLDEPLVETIEDQIVIEIQGEMTFGIEIFDVPINVIKKYTCIIKVNKNTGITEFKWFYENAQ